MKQYPFLINRLDPADADQKKPSRVTFLPTGQNIYTPAKMPKKPPCSRKSVKESEKVLSRSTETVYSFLYRENLFLTSINMFSTEDVEYL